jgi:pimeloyl-ACP methyl ester carboxylesterase
VWRETVAHLNAKGFQTHSLTIAGFGGTKPISTDHLLNTVRDDLATYIGQNKLDHPVVIGHSLGGFIALSLAAQHPDLTGKVISVDGLPYLPVMMNPTITVEGARNMAAGIKAQMMTPQSEEKRRESAKETLSSMVTSPENIDREIKVALIANQGTVAEAMSEMMSIDLRSDVAKIKTPVLVLGTWIAYKDYGVTRESQIAAYSKQFEKLPGAKIMVSETSRHFIQLDVPEWFYSQMDQFLLAKN